LSSLVGLNPLSFVAGFQEASLCGDSEELSPSNPFLQIQQKEMPFDIVMQAVQVITHKIQTVVRSRIITLRKNEEM